MDNHFHVAMATDDNYTMLTGISMYSLFKNNTSFEKISLHILDNNISNENKEKLTEIAKNFNREILFYDCSKIGEWLGKEILDMFHTKTTNVPISSYARLFLPQILDENIDKILYLDGDSLILNSYEDLWSIDNSQYSIMGVIDNVNETSKTKIGLDKNHNYINAGSILLNLKTLRKMNFINTMKSFIDKHHGHVFHHDQGILNALLCNSMGYLPPQYNMMSFVYESNTANTIKSLYDLPYYYTDEEIMRAKQHPVFVHFTEGNVQRPWVKGCKHPLRKEWELYKNETVWKNVPQLPDNRSLKLKILAWINLKLPFLNKLIRKVRK